MNSLARQHDIAFQANLYADPNPTRRSLHSVRRAWVEHALAEVGPGTRILEVGVGCGIFTQFLSRTGAQVTAIDINPDFVEGVQGLPNVSAHVRDATRPFDVENQDVVLSSEVLEHVPPDRSIAMLREIRASLKPGGLFILTTPQRYATMELAARMLQFPPVLALARKIYGNVDELGHINLLTSSQLQRQFEMTGFRIERQECFGFYLPVIADFGGKTGLNLLRRIEAVIRHIPVLRELLWTQAYVLRAC
jgi:2-polyprenyl-6-hydroxyphenyl methylase/3-demethylubiquinone-9 3-methyltransferase